ncbi:MAG: hypothetical protein U0R49_09775 [Fimbriimonadales bacterium]
MIKLATFNVENMFERAKAMNLPNWKDGKPILSDYYELNNLIQQKKYTPAIKKKILQVMDRHQGLKTKSQSKYLRLRDIRGGLLAKPRGGPIGIKANGRSDWIGWFELEREPISEVATENTARVIDLLDADILCVIEAENRTTLKRFNDEVLPVVGAKPYKHVMLIDGNDDRGIDVGILTRKHFEIGTMRSHVDDEDSKGNIFSRDCAEYEIDTPSGNTLLILLNHFKSKGYGKQSENDAKRKRQTKRVRTIYDQRKKDGYKYIAVVGDFNEIPNNDPLSPLLRSGSDLIDISDHKTYQSDGRDGTHGNASASSKLDYILLSPKLAAKTKAGGVERRGVWGGTKGTLFPHLPEMKSAKDAASDHAALWAEFDI